MEGEVTLWLVDQAVIDISPISLRNLSQELSFSNELSSPLFDDFNLTTNLCRAATTSNTQNLVSKEVYEKVFEILKRRTEWNPWLQVNWETLPEWWVIPAIEIANDEILDKTVF